MKKNIAIIVLVIIILAGGAYLFGKNSKETKEIEENVLPQNVDNSVVKTPAQNVPVVNNVANKPVATSDCTPNTKPFIKVLSPNGGETYTAGQQILVKWKSCNIQTGSNVSIFLDGFESMNSPYRWSTLVSAGSYLWTVPNMSATNVPAFSLGFNAVGVHALSGAFTINSATNQSNIITKNDWGISFVKNSDWGIVTNTSSEISLKKNIGQSEGDVIKISYVSGQSITDTDAKFGNITYYYDGNSNKWMKTTNENGIVTSIATTSLYTTDNFPVFPGTGRWKTYIIPTSHTTFIKLNIGGSGYSQPLTDLLQTIKKI